MVLTGKAQVAKRTTDGGVVAAGTRSFTAIPYYAWAHRGRSPMTVWAARELQAARPEPADTLTYKSKTTASFVHKSLDAIKDQDLPENSADESALHLDFWPHKGTTEWIQFEWPEKHELSGVKVYWFDDTGRGECHLPKSWQVLYRTAEGKFEPVKNATPYGIEKDTFNQVRFEPVTDGRPQDRDYSAGPLVRRRPGNRDRIGVSCVYFCERLDGWLRQACGRTSSGGAIS